MYHYTSVEDDFFMESNSDSQDFWGETDYHESFDALQRPEKVKKPLREKNYPGRNSGYKHVPHSEKPPQVVAKRNARERRRVQAVNNAFVKLRNAVPIQNSRGKRISKVKTLLYAMDYIRTLDNILRECKSYSSPCEMIECGLPKNLDNGTSSKHWDYGKDSFPLGRFFT